MTCRITVIHTIITSTAHANSLPANYKSPDENHRKKSEFGTRSRTLSLAVSRFFKSSRPCSLQAIVSGFGVPVCRRNYWRRKGRPGRGGMPTPCKSGPCP